MLIHNFYYYLAHQDELIERYNGKHLVISDKKVIFASENRTDAFEQGVTLAGLENFIVQLCTPGEEAYTSRCYTPWVRITNALSLC